MNLLGVGPFEILLILVIATIVLGPERMAQAGRTLGRLYAQYRYRWQKDVDEMTRELRRELAMLQRELDEIRHTTEGEIKAAQDTLQSIADTKIDLDTAASTDHRPDEQTGTRDASAKTDTEIIPAQETNETDEVEG